MPVVNFHHYKSVAKLNEVFGPDGWMYVGRENQQLARSPLANPFVNDPRKNGILADDPIGAYRSWLWEKMQAKDQKVMDALAKVQPGMALVCWCAPRPCHAEVIDKAAAWLRAQAVVAPVEELPTIALSIQQPWAWLIIRPDITDPAERAAAYAAGIIKDIENRTWATNFRGRVLVHTGKAVDKDAYPYLAREFPWLKVPRPEELPTGGIVGVVEITDCVRQSRSRWFGGEYGFVLAEAMPLPYKAMPGKLKFFHCEYA
ncbi:MAG: DUF4326 domain-containing protein [Chloroflexi bacterium]|nr:DUF4326 domain-containing protein [Chloroflexota bacterium]